MKSNFKRIILYYIFIFLFPISIYSQVSFIKKIDVVKNITAIAITDDDRFLYTGSNDGYLKKWNIDSWQELKSIKAHSKIINDIGLYKNTYLVSVSSDNFVKIWNTQLDSLICEYKAH